MKEADFVSGSSYSSDKQSQACPSVITFLLMSWKGLTMNSPGDPLWTRDLVAGGSQGPNQNPGTQGPLNTGPLTYEAIWPGFSLSPLWQ